MDIGLSDQPHDFHVNRLPEISTGTTRDVNVCHPVGFHHKRTIDLSYARPPCTSAPSWKLEKYFSPAVMTGNWIENRLASDKGDFTKNYKPIETTRTDVADKQSAFLNKTRSNTGAGKEIISNYMDLYKHNHVTFYDENYNQRWREKKLPILRTWNLTYDAWVPEKSDHPFVGPSTDYGLLKTLRKKWEKSLQDEKKTYDTIYRLDFSHYPYNNLVRKHAQCLVPYANDKKSSNVPCVYPHFKNPQ